MGKPNQHPHHTPTPHVPNTPTQPPTSTLPTTPPTPPTPLAVFTPPTPTAPVVKRGTSTVKYPVGVVWVTCINHTIQNNNTTPTRKVLHTACITAGVTYYTVRTQVNLYLGWVRGGCTPNGLPRGVVLPPNTPQFTLGTTK